MSVFLIWRGRSNLHIELKTLSEKSGIIEEKTNEFDEKAMDFENAELEGLKKKDKKNEDKLKSLKINCSIKRYIIEEKTCVSLESPNLLPVFRIHLV